MFASKDDFKEQYLAEFTKTMAKPFEECTKRERYEVLAKMICSRQQSFTLKPGCGT